ncbi:hypothetical protein [Clostridium felsineum]|uniref:hypothetical protein n=1 Tax=Clostridium felsineum TaxID=36839 RepID=UPI0009CB35D1|nr:hypothetical protein [Clostridium felsineum]URZ18785.1 hypothetical protein CLFE_048730 [Clostridium felsineum DSM 794]
MKEEKYYIIKKKYLADALSFLGFRYYKFNNVNYSFINTNKFREALTSLTDLKKRFK